MKKMYGLFILMFTFCLVVYAKAAPVPYSSGNDYYYSFYSGTYVSIYEAEIPQISENSKSDNANTHPADLVHAPPAHSTNEISKTNYYALSGNSNDQSDTLTGFYLTQNISVGDADSVASNSKAYSQATARQNGYLYPEMSGNLRLYINISGSGTDGDAHNPNHVKCIYSYTIIDFGSGDTPQGGDTLWSENETLFDKEL